MFLTEKQINSFYTKFSKSNAEDCWEWQCSLCPKGYGRMRTGSTTNGTRRHTKAHRISFFLANGFIDPELLVRHKCDNPLCVNPNHLEQGTIQDNSDDMVKRGRSHLCGRSQSGLNNANCRLKLDDVIEIKRLLPLKNNKQIAEIFGVTHSNISLIRRGKAWADISPDGP